MSEKKTGKKTTKEMRKELRTILKEDNVRAIRMILYIKNAQGIPCVHDIVEGSHIVNKGFKYSGFLESRCLHWDNQIVDIEAVKHDQTDQKEM